jgi:two-component system sensor histidine kinase DesK
MFTLPLNVGVLTVAVLAATAEISARTIVGWEGEQWSAAFSTLFAGAAVYAARIAFGRNRDLMAAREEMAQMAVAEERSRMTRDLHDILGHSLTVITVKAELAGRLLGADEDRAAAEIADIERLAREALTDVRATIAGRRAVSLAPELANARGALIAANIEADMPNAVDEVPAGNRELFGWAVREGVTNVLRHSKASHCIIRLTSTSVA